MPAAPVTITVSEMHIQDSPPRLIAGHRTRVKICGITTPEDARHAVCAGADALGLVFYQDSPRHVTVDSARRILEVVPPFVARVALFVDAPGALVREVVENLPIEWLQFHGDESESQCQAYGKPWIKALRLRPGQDSQALAQGFPAAAGLLFDNHDPQRRGGTGQCFDWRLVAATISQPLILAGGLTPDNVRAAISQVRPWAVDVSSGVESVPGRKDLARMRAFIQAVECADER